MARRTEHGRLSPLPPDIRPIDRYAYRQTHDLNGDPRRLRLGCSTNQALTTELSMRPAPAPALAIAVAAGRVSVDDLFWIERQPELCKDDDGLHRHILGGGAVMHGRFLQNCRAGPQLALRAELLAWKNAAVNTSYRRSGIMGAVGTEAFRTALPCTWLNVRSWGLPPIRCPDWTLAPANVARTCFDQLQSDYGRAVPAWVSQWTPVGHDDASMFVFYYGAQRPTPDQLVRLEDLVFKDGLNFGQVDMPLPGTESNAAQRRELARCARHSLIGLHDFAWPEARALCASAEMSGTTTVRADAPAAAIERLLALPPEQDGRHRLV